MRHQITAVRRRGAAAPAKVVVAVVLAPRGHEVVLLVLVNGGRRVVRDGPGFAGTKRRGRRAWAYREGGVRARGRGALNGCHVVASSSVPPSPHGCFGSLEGWYRDSPRQRGRSVSSPACVAMWALAGAQVAVGAGERGDEFGGRLRATGRLKGRPAVVCAPSLLIPSRASPQRPPRSAPNSPSANVRTALLLNLLKNLYLVLSAVVARPQRWDLHLGEGRGVRRPRRHGVDCPARARVLHGPSTRWNRFANCSLLRVVPA